MSNETCPKCGVAVTADEKFCSGCGGALSTGIGAGVLERNAPYASHDLSQGNPHLGTARKWLMAISIITLISGFIFYAMQKSQIEKEHRDADAQVAGLPQEELDAHMMREVGMTYEEAKKHDVGMVNMLLFVNIGLAVIYFGLWFWAKKNAYAAALIALLLFLTVIVVSAVMEPKSLGQGIIVKILFIAALGKAVAAGREERKYVTA